MMPHDETESRKKKTEFESLGEEKPLNLAYEFAYFLAENKKWWLAPIILVLAGVGLLVLLGSTGAAPFIYTLF